MITFLNGTKSVGGDVEDERIWIWIVVCGVWNSGGQVWDDGIEEVGSVELCVLAWKMLAVAVVDWTEQEELDPWARVGLAVVEWW